ncbi:hypothetical protein [Streptomyces prunicolor]|uniref:hypothetical protein n=1 Tax=Streptomyces prunicolor TaxID=67348 RepID=UPI003F5E2702
MSPSPHGPARGGHGHEQHRRLTAPPGPDLTDLHAGPDRHVPTNLHLPPALSVRLPDLSLRALPDLPNRPAPRLIRPRPRPLPLRRTAPLNHRPSHLHRAKPGHH